VTIARLHLITPETLDPSVLARTKLALAAGAPWVQVRTKQGTDQARLAQIAAVQSAAAAHGATCIVNDRADLALAGDTAGVHLGLDDLPVHAARSLLGPDAIVGATCRDGDDARRAVDEGASYLGVGPVWTTRTKAGLPEPIGLDGLSRVVDAVADRRGHLGRPVPVIAISGITRARVPAVLDAGAHGVAVVAAIYDAEDIAGATRSLLAALEPSGQSLAAPALEPS
jgi:thiamine-phosphate pyrophosphorylase